MLVKPWKSVARTSLYIAIALASQQIHAEPIEVRTSLSSEYSDNIRRTANKEDDIVYTASVGASYKNQEGAFNNTFDGLLGFETYQNNTYGNDVTMDINWLTLAHIIPSRLLWRFQDSLKDTRQTSTRPFTPDNRERRNFLSTGPSYFLPISNSDTLRALADYSRTDYEHSTQADTYRYSGSLGWLHLTPGRLNIDWNNHVETVVYDDDTELFNKATSLALSKKHEFVDWRVEAGYAQTDSEQLNGDATYDGFEGEASLRYRISTDASLRFFASHQLTDTSSQFAVLIFDMPFTFNVQQVVKLTLYQFGYDHNLTARDRVSVSLVRRYEDYQTTQETEESNGFSARWTHQFTTLISGHIYADYENRQFSLFNREDNQAEVGLGMTANLYRNLAIEAFAGYQKQTSDEALYDYDEVRVGAKLVYYPSLDF